MNPFQRIVSYGLIAGIVLIGIAAIISRIPEGVSLPDMPDGSLLPSGAWELIASPSMWVIVVIITALFAWRVTWLRAPLVVLVAVGTFVFWTEIRDGFAAWFANSDANAQIGLEEDTISSWFWLAVPVIAWIGWSLLRPKKTKSPFQPISIADAFWSLVGTIIILVPYVGGGAVALVLALAFGDILTGGKVQDLIDQAAGIPVQREDPGCNLQEYIRANGMVVPSSGATIVICPGDGLTWLAVQPRMQLDVQYASDFYTANRQVLENRNMFEFFYFERGGGVRDGYSFSVNDQGFTSSGLNSMKLFIRSIPQ